MTKLTGAAYLNYWRKRIAKGPEQVGHGGSSIPEVEHQGAMYFWYLSTAITLFDPLAHYDRILEFGSGWGRILKLARGFYPEAELFGVELCEEAVKDSWHDERTRLFVGAQVPETIRNVDLAITCTVLQHITDPEYLKKAADSIVAAVRPQGVIALLENVMATKAEHVLGWTVDQYMDLFPEVVWSPQRSSIISYRGEPHAILVGRRK